MSDFNYQPMLTPRPQVMRAPRVLVAKYGDGYEQRQADGINNDLRVWRGLVFRSIDLSVIDAIDDFFALKNAVISFTWTPSGEAELRVKCTAWSRTPGQHDAQEVVADFEEVLA